MATVCLSLRSAFFNGQDFLCDEEMHKYMVRLGYFTLSFALPNLHHKLPESSMYKFKKLEF